MGFQIFESWDFSFKIIIIIMREMRCLGYINFIKLVKEGTRKGSKRDKTKAICVRK